MARVTIPSRLDERTLGRIYPAIGAVDGDLPGKVIFDFSALSFIRSCGIAYIANLADYLDHNSVKVHYAGLDNGSAAMVYLDDSGFFKRELGKPLRANASLRSTTYQLKSVRREDARQWLEFDFMLWLSGRTGYSKAELSNVASGLEELLNNVVDHTQFDIGSIYAQHHPREDRVIVSVADIGIGIAANVKAHHPELTDAAAICRAAEYGFSTKGNPNRGVGLNHILSNVVGLNGGRTIIRSASGCVAFEQEGADFSGKVLNMHGSCIGTMIEMSIPTDCMEWVGGNDKEEEEFEW